MQWVQPLKLQIFWVFVLMAVKAVNPLGEPFQDYKKYHSKPGEAIITKTPCLTTCGFTQLLD